MTTLTLPDLIAHLQRRVARLLLRHDQRTFRSKFRALYAQSALPELPDLRAYDIFTRLIALADELFDDILPRIRRQLSFQATRLRLDEEPPLRGQIDWPRSLLRTWDTHPDHPPTRFATHVRSRTFATPENQLVVAVLNAYAHALNRARSGPLFKDAPLTAQEQRELARIEDQVRRELATTHFQELAREADQWEPDECVKVVEQRLRAGSSPYRDLIAWWQRYTRLHLRQTTAAGSTTVLANPDQAGLLYQLWIALELVEFLAERHALAEPHIQANRLTFTFTWQNRRFCLVYDRQPTPYLAWDQAPGERPDYFITRANACAVVSQDRLIWQEPGVLLDAKCYLGDSSARATGPIKRMLADMHLLDTTHGALIMPDISNLPTVIVPRRDRYLAVVDPQSAVRLFELRPLEQIDHLHQRIAELLDTVATWLPERAPVTCHGMLQDKDTVNPGASPPQMCRHCGRLMAICPKPHISSGHVDLVCPHCDCLHNPTICHIMAREAHVALRMPPFLRRVLNEDQLLASIAQIRDRLQQHMTIADESESAETMRNAVIHAIGDLAESYVDWKQPDTQSIEEKLRWVFGGYWHADQHARGLPEDVRHMLISGEFVWSELQRTNVQDWAACAVQYVRAVERELHRRLYACCGDPSHLRNYRGQALTSSQFTFGTISTAYNRRTQNDHNWQTLLTHAVHPSQADPALFEAVIASIVSLRERRNEIAHSVRVDRAMAATVRDIVLGQPDHPGALRQFVALLDAAPG